MLLLSQITIKTVIKTIVTKWPSIEGPRMSHRQKLIIVNIGFEKKKFSFHQRKLVKLKT